MRHGGPDPRPMANLMEKRHEGHPISRRIPLEEVVREGRNICIAPQLLVQAPSSERIDLLGTKAVGLTWVPSI